MQRIRPSLDWLIKNVGATRACVPDLHDGATLAVAETVLGSGSPDDLVVRGLTVPRSGSTFKRDRRALPATVFADDNLASMIVAAVRRCQRRPRSTPRLWATGVRRKQRVRVADAGSIARRRRSRLSPTTVTPDQLQTRSTPLQPDRTLADPISLSTGVWALQSQLGMPDLADQRCGSTMARCRLRSVSDHKWDAMTAEYG